MSDRYTLERESADITGQVMAVRRLENTEKRLKRSSDIAVAYNKCILQYVEKGYIRKIPEYEKCESKWYLPHFPVIRLDKKKQPKLGSYLMRQPSMKVYL